MTWPDLIVIVLCILLGILEAQRGFIVAFLDMLGVFLTVEIAPAAYLNLTRSGSLSNVAAYLICIGIGVAITAIVTTLLKRQTQFDIGSFDSALGGIFGIIIALFLSHAMYGALILAYGAQNPVYANSAFAPQIFELQGLKGFLRFMGKIGTTEIATN